MGDINKAIEYYQKSIDLDKKKGNQEGVAFSLNNLGILYELIGDLQKALECQLESLKIKEELGDTVALGNCLNNIGYIYHSQKLNEKALEYYNQSRILDSIMGNTEGVAMSYLNIGTVFDETGKLDSSIVLYKKSLALFQSLNNIEGIGQCLINLGVTYSMQKELDLALNYFHQGLEMYTQIQQEDGICWAYGGLANVHIEKKQYLKSIEYGEKALSIAQDHGYVEEIMSAAEVLYISYKSIGLPNEALGMHELYMVMKDSIFNQSNKDEIVRLELTYQHEKQKTLDDAEHDIKIAIEQEEKEKQQVISYTIAGGLFLVILFLIFVFNRLRVTKKQKNIIEEQKDIVELAHHELEEKNNEIMDSIAYAKRIQSAILPSSQTIKEYLPNSFILYKPKDIVAGDFYWLEHHDGEVLFAAADCTGHGVPGAMVSVVCNNGLNRSVREHGLTDPGKILDKTREIVIQEFEKSEDEVKDGMDIALCRLKGNILQYAGAHNPLWIVRNGEILETKADKQPIGKFDRQTPYSTHTIELEKEDCIYIFSDGYIDQFGGEKGKKLKSKTFKKLLLSIQDNSMNEQHSIINDYFEKWKGNLEQIDDVCIIGVRI